jgi:hypothetical protein
MIRTLIVLLLALPILSFAPPPAAPPPVYWTRIAVQTSALVAQDCTFETATARLQQPIFDPAGYPFGEVRAWSCTGDALAVARELESRAAAMQADARAYREAHPIGGVR